MKRSTADAGQPPQPRIYAIPVFNQTPSQGAPVPNPVPLPPTMTSVQRPAVAVWPQPSQAFFTFSANQAYPPRSLGLPSTPPVFHGTPHGTLPPSSHLPSKAPSSSSGRYTHAQVSGKTQLIVTLTTPDDLIDLAETLRRPTTVTKINVVTWSPKELQATFEAIRTSLAVFDLEVTYKGPMPAPIDLNSIFSAFQNHQAPIKSFKWVSTQANAKPLTIDQRVFEALFGSQLLESVHFSAPRGDHSTSVIANDPDRLALCVQKHQSLKSLSLERIRGEAFINAILQGVANSPLIDEIHLDSPDLAMCSTALQAAVTNNTKLRSVSIKGCQFELGVMPEILKSIQKHPGLVSLDFSKAKLADYELKLIGEPIGELLVTNPQMQTLGFPCALSPENISALEIGFSANTNLSLLVIALEDDASVPDLPENGARHDIGALFKSNKGLREIVIRLPSLELDANHPVLEGIADSASIESLTIENFFDIYRVIDLMAHNPRITHLNLKMREIGFQNIAWLADGVNQLADNMRNNKDLLSFNLAIHGKDKSGSLYSYSSHRIDAGILRIDDVTTRNRARNMATLAGAVMSRRQDLMPNVPGALPPLPPEINRMIFEATLDNLAPGDAKKIYDTVLPFTPLPKNQ
jgi:hypothetical protein